MLGPKMLSLGNEVEVARPEVTEKRCFVFSLCLSVPFISPLKLLVVITIRKWTNLISIFNIFTALVRLQARTSLRFSLRACVRACARESVVRLGARRTPMESDHGT